MTREELCAELKNLVAQARAMPDAEEDMRLQIFFTLPALDIIIESMENKNVH